MEDSTRQVDGGGRNGTQVSSIWTNFPSFFWILDDVRLCPVVGIGWKLVQLKHLGTPKKFGDSRAQGVDDTFWLSCVAFKC